MRGTVGALLATLALAACGDSGGDTNQNHPPCPTGHDAVEGACVPIFDDCPSDTEIPVLGGGCQRVGITGCAAGFEPDGEDGCAPLLPAEECPAGTLPILGQTDCQPVGVASCPLGFVSDSAGGCDPVLPTAPCPAGTIAMLGETTCQPIDDCGTGTWGDIPTDPTTVYVDGSNGDDGWPGTDASPLATIGAALQVVASGGQIAVAEGAYVERLQLSDTVRLRGRCASLVTVHGATVIGIHHPPITVYDSADQSVISGLTLTGNAEGLILRGASGVVVESVQVIDAQHYGVRADMGADPLLRRVVISGAKPMGLYVKGAQVTLEDSEIRDSLPGDDDLYGRGINAECSSVSGGCGGLTVIRSVLQRNIDVALYSSGVPVSFAESVARDTEMGPYANRFGRGIYAKCNDAGECGLVEITDSVIAHNHDVGVSLWGPSAVVTNSTIRDTWSEREDTQGWGLAGECHAFTGSCGTLDVSDTRITNNVEFGLYSGGYSVSLTRTLIDHTQANVAGGLGLGVNGQCSSVGQTCGTYDIHASLITDNLGAGITFVGMDVSLTDSVVRRTLPQPADGMAGRGVEAICVSAWPACGSVTLTNSVVSENRHIGVFLDGVPLTMEGSLIERTREQADPSGRYFGHGLQAQCSLNSECGAVLLRDSLLRENVGTGVSVGGIDLTLENTVVRDTLPREIDAIGGSAVSAECDPGLGICGSFTVRDCLITDNRYIGLIGVGLPMQVSGTIVRNILAQVSDDLGGRGIVSQCEFTHNTCDQTSIADTLVTACRNAGISTLGSDLHVEGVVISDIVPMPDPVAGGSIAVGVVAMCSAWANRCPLLEVSGSSIRNTVSSGVSSIGASGYLESSRINGVDRQPDDEAYGYGVQIAAVEGAPAVTFDVRQSDIRGAVLSGMLYHQTSGTVSRNRVAGCGFSVVMNPGSSPDVTDDNVYEDNLVDGPDWQNMDPAPAPQPMLPESLFGQ